jgi:hypothetical protein
LLVAVVASAGAVTIAWPVNAESSPFTKIDTFAIKTGYRGVVVWEASSVVQPILHFGESAGDLDRTASTIGGAPDSAGVVIAEGLTIGRTYIGQLEDRLTGTRSDPFPIEAKNANSAWDPIAEAYTINMLVQIDTQALPPEVPGDLALGELSQGMSVFAERVHDATDGYVRIGKVLVTDTNFDYTPNVPFVTPDVYYDVTREIARDLWG